MAFTVIVFVQLSGYCIKQTKYKNYYAYSFAINTDDWQNLANEIKGSYHVF
jgi:hypothetical protein